MAITIVAENISDAAERLGIHQPRGSVVIQWRRNDDYRYDGRGGEPGCIVDATSVPGEETKRSFPKSSDALRYLAAIFKKRDGYVRDEKKKREKEIRAAAKKAKESPR